MPLNLSRSTLPLIPRDRSRRRVLPHASSSTTGSACSGSTTSSSRTRPADSDEKSALSHVRVPEPRSGVDQRLAPGRRLRRCSPIVDLRVDGRGRLAAGHLDVDHRRQIAVAERAHLLEHQVGLRDRVLARLEELVDAADEPGRFRARPVLREVRDRCRCRRRRG